MATLGRRVTWCCSTPARRCTWRAWPESMADGVQRAAAELDSGRVRAKVQQVAEASQRIKAELASVPVA